MMRAEFVMALSCLFLDYVGGDYKDYKDFDDI